MRLFFDIFAVGAYAASWIEILLYSQLLVYPGRSLCGFVDWNMEMVSLFFSLACRSLCGFVDWNQNIGLLDWLHFCRSLCGFVDWNFYHLFNMGADTTSEPMRLRGLKCLSGYFHEQPLYVGAYAASWIEIMLSVKLFRAWYRRSLCGFVDWN